MRENEIIITKSESATNTIKHFHNAHEILYITRGAVRAGISGSGYEVGGGTLIFISNLEIHNIDAVEFPYHRYFVLIPAEMLGRVAPGGVLGSIFTNRGAGFNHCVDVNGFRDEIDGYFSKMHDEYLRDGDFRGEYIESCLQQLLICLFRRRREAFPQPKGGAEDVVYKVKEYIENNFRDDIRINETAEKFYVNSFYLSHSFKRVTGYNPKQFLMLCRLAQARELLCESDLPINKISEETGFGDVNNFIRFFKREVGMTPLQYRKSAEIH